LYHYRSLRFNFLKISIPIIPDRYYTSRFYGDDRPCFHLPSSYRYASYLQKSAIGAHFSGSARKKGINPEQFFVILNNSSIILQQTFFTGHVTLITKNKY